MFRVKSLHYFGFYSQFSIQELNYFEKVVNKEKNIRRIQSTDESEDNQMILRLSEMSFSLICLGIGFCLSVLIFIGEIVIKIHKIRVNYNDLRVTWIRKPVLKTNNGRKCTNINFSPLVKING